LRSQPLFFFLFLFFFFTFFGFIWFFAREIKWDQKGKKKEKEKGEREKRKEKQFSFSIFFEFFIDEIQLSFGFLCFFHCSLFFLFRKGRKVIELQRRKQILKMESKKVHFSTMKQSASVF
jgi:hypothetical protein